MPSCRERSVDVGGTKGIRDAGNKGVNALPREQVERARNSQREVSKRSSMISRTVLKKALTTVCLVSSTFGVFSIPAGASSAPGATTPTPDVPSCPPGQYYSVTSSSAVDYGTGAPSDAYNFNAAVATMDVTVDTSSTTNYAISATATVSAGIIFTSVEASTTASLGYSHTVGLSKTVSVNIPAHEYGIYQDGNEYTVTNGTTFTESSTCVESNAASITARFPWNTSTGQIPIVGVSTSPTPPWPQA